MPWKLREAFGKERVPRRIKRRSFDRNIPTLAELQTKLDSVRREVRNLTVMGMDPNQQRNRQRWLKSSSVRREQSNVCARWPLITRSHGKPEGRAALDYFGP